MQLIRLTRSGSLYMPPTTAHDWVACGRPVHVGDVLRSVGSGNGGAVRTGCKKLEESHGQEAAHDDPFEAPQL